MLQNYEPFVIKYAGRYCSGGFTQLNLLLDKVYSDFECEIKCIEFGEECKEFVIYKPLGWCFLSKNDCQAYSLDTNYDVYSSPSDKVSAS